MKKGKKKPENFENEKISNNNNNNEKSGLLITSSSSSSPLIIEERGLESLESEVIGNGVTVIVTGQGVGVTNTNTNHVDENENDEKEIKKVENDNVINNERNEDILEKRKRFEELKSEYVNNNNIKDKEESIIGIGEVVDEVDEEFKEFKEYINNINTQQEESNGWKVVEEEFKEFKGVGDDVSDEWNKIGTVVKSKYNNSNQFNYSINAMNDDDFHGFRNALTGEPIMIKRDVVIAKKSNIKADILGLKIKEISREIKMGKSLNDICAQFDITSEEICRIFQSKRLNQRNNKHLEFKSIGLREDLSFDEIRWKRVYSKTDSPHTFLLKDLTTQFHPSSIMLKPVKTFKYVDTTIGNTVEMKHTTFNWIFTNKIEESSFVITFGHFFLLKIYDLKSNNECVNDIFFKSMICERLNHMGDDNYAEIRNLIMLQNGDIAFTLYDDNESFQDFLVILKFKRNEISGIIDYRSKDIKFLVFENNCKICDIFAVGNDKGAIIAISHKRVLYFDYVEKSKEGYKKGKEIMMSSIFAEDINSRSSKAKNLLIPKSSRILVGKNDGSVVLFDLSNNKDNDRLMNRGKIIVKFYTSIEYMKILRFNNQTYKIAIAVNGVLKIFNIYNQDEIIEESILALPENPYSDLGYVPYTKTKYRTIRRRFSLENVECLSHNHLLTSFTCGTVYVWNVSEKRIVSKLSLCSELNKKPSKVLLKNKSVLVRSKNGIKQLVVSMKGGIEFYDLNELSRILGHSSSKIAPTDERMNFIFENLSDEKVHFKNSGKVLNTFRFLLCRSSYLKDKMLKGEKIETNFSEETVSIALSFLTGKEIVIIDKENVYEVHELANKWNLKYLEYLCLQQILMLSKNEVSQVVIEYLIKKEESTGTSETEICIEKISSPLQIACFTKIKRDFHHYINKSVKKRLLKYPNLLYNLAIMSHTDLPSIVDLDYFKGVNLFASIHQKYMEHISSLFDQREMSNLILRSVDGKEFNVHKQILILNSEYFYLIFRNSFEESFKDIIEVLDMDVIELGCYLEFIYKRRIDNMEKDDINLIINLLKFADKYLDKPFEIYLISLFEQVSIRNKKELFEIVFKHQHMLQELPERIQDRIINIWSNCITINSLNQKKVIKMVMKLSIESNDKLIQSNERIKELENENINLQEQISLLKKI